MGAGRSVALIGGGHSSEHDISLQSTACLGQALLDAGFAVSPLIIGEDGTWNLGKEVPAHGTLAALPAAVADRWDTAVVSGGPASVLDAVLARSVAACVLGLHGRGGEDGSLQGFLDVARVPYTGSGVVASALAVDKVHFKRLLLGAGLPTPEHRVASRRELEAPGELTRFGDNLGWPLVVKPPGLGSSVGVAMVSSPSELEAAVAEALRHGPRVLLERVVPGREVTGPVFGSADQPEPLPLIEIVPHLAGWFDKASKYQPGGADEIVPAPLDAATTARLQDLCTRVHGLIGARGVTRTDIMLDETGEPWILETNTLPGMTSGSLVPKSVVAAGMTLPEFAERLVADAIRAG